LSPGFIHGFNLSLAAEPGERCFALARVRISNLSSIWLGQIVAAGGASTSIAHDFTAPIAVLFDPTAETADVGIRTNGDAGAQCAAALTLIYENL
jgi:hypothetical protein